KKCDEEIKRGCQYSRLISFTQKKIPLLRYVNKGIFYV
ncbi:hypothetical protein BMETH_16864886032155, partial [methanotrophic bacterial endosymbiont of Bathymodiolus sp.]